MSGKRPVIQCLPVAPVPITRVLYSGAAPPNATRAEIRRLFPCGSLAGCRGRAKQVAHCAPR